MYIRRKVFSVYTDEYGEERYFSTNEIMSEDDYVEALFSDNDNSGAIAGAAGLAAAGATAGVAGYKLNKFNNLRATANDKNLEKAKKAAEKAHNKEIAAINKMDFAGKGKKTGAQMRQAAIDAETKRYNKVIKGLETSQSKADKQLKKIEKNAGKYLGENWSKGKVGKWLAKNPKTAIAAGALGAGTLAAGTGYSARKAVD